MRRSVVIWAAILGLVIPAASQRTTPPPRSTPRPARTGPINQPTTIDVPEIRQALDKIPQYPKVDKRTVTFKTESKLVLVPAIVRRGGKHVSGLDKDAFTVYQDGKLQRITAFEEVRDAASNRMARPKTPEGVFTNVVSTDTAHHQITIVMLDLLNTPLVDQARARDELLRFLARSVDASNPTALVALGEKGVRLLHDFTNDPALLAAALRRAGSENPDTHVPVPQAQMTLQEAALNQADPRLVIEAIDELSRGGTEYRQGAAIATTMEAFQHLAHAFAGVQGRKALIWATAGFPFTVTESSGILGTGEPSSLYERTMQLLNAANIALYPVDVRGLVYFGGSVAAPGQQSLPLTQRDLTISKGRRMDTAAPSDYSGAVQAATLATMDIFAAMTGGRAFYNRNDLDIAFREAATDSDSYYLLGYQLDISDRTSGWRKLKVEVNQPGTEVRARSGFFVTPVTEDPTYTRAVDIYNAVQSPIDYTGLPFVVRWTGVENEDGKRKAAFEIVLSANSVHINEDGRIELEFVGVARDAQGKAAKEFMQTFKAKLKPSDIEQIKSSGITYRNVLEVPAGDYSVRFVVRDNFAGRVGSLVAPLRSPVASGPR